MAAGKPIPQLKKTLPPAEAMQAFVDAEADSSAAARTSPAQEVETSVKAPKRQKKPSRETPKSPSTTKKVTYYFPEELDRRLAIYAVTNRLKMSNIVVEAVEAFLARVEK